MKYKVKKTILGFDQIHDVELTEKDKLFSVLKDSDSETAFTLVNPYQLKENYSFDIPKNVQVLLEINENSNLLVFCITVLQSPLEESKVNFNAPLIFNQDNQTMAQFVIGGLEVDKRLGDYKRD